jgi:hypothetical protein
VVINNRLLPDINARFILCADPASGASSSVGTDFSVLFFGGLPGTPFASLQPLDPSNSSMRGPAGSAGAGYFVPVTVSVPSVAVGSQADIWLQLVTTAGIKDAPLGPFTVTLGGGVIVPPNLPLGTTPLISYLDCPEPSTALLSAVAFGCLILLRKGPGTFLRFLSSGKTRF